MVEIMFLRFIWIEIIFDNLKALDLTESLAESFLTLGFLSLVV